MPYKNGKWVLGEESYKVLMDTDRDEQALISAFIKEGDLEEGEFLRDLWQPGASGEAWERTDWNTELGSNWAKRYDVLKEYAKKYGTTIPRDMGPNEKGVDNSYGLGLERESGGDDLNLEDQSAKQIMEMLYGDKKYEIDYAHYNDNIAYRSTISHMQAEFTDMRADFTSVRQIRNAQRILNTPGYVVDKEWTKQNAMPYSDGEIEALEDFKKHNVTRHFDSEYNITTHLDPKDSRSLSVKLYEARKANNYTRMEEPAAPEWLNIVGGTAPKEEYNSAGKRVVADGDVKSMYQRYLGREFRIDKEDTVYKDGDKKGIKQSEIDYWEKAAADNKWNYDDLVQNLKSSSEGLKNTDRGRIFYNPNQGKEAEISKKLVAEPKAITPPSLTIRKLKGGVKKPSNLSDFNVKTTVSGGG